MEYMESRMQQLHDRPEYDDRVTPLLLHEASRRDATSWNDDDAIAVIAHLLSQIDALECTLREREAAGRPRGENGL